MTIATEKLTATSVRQNNDTRKISAWVAIIAVPTAVTGFFGQNVPYPGFSAHSGLYASSVIIVVVAAALYVMFRLKSAHLRVEPRDLHRRLGLQCDDVVR